MSRRQKPLPYFLSRFGYWHLDIAYPLIANPGLIDRKMSLAQEAQEETGANVDAILSGHDNPQHPEYRPDLRLELEAMQISPEHDERIRALHYWIARDRLWYTDGKAGILLRALPDRPQQALEALNQETWAPPSQSWTWSKLLPQIAKDQIIFHRIKELGPTKSGVAGNDPAIARQRLGVSQTEARTVYLAYQPQGAALLGEGIRPSEAWKEWFSEEGLLTQSGRVAASSLGARFMLDPLHGTVRVDTPRLPDWDTVFHWFAHALRNLARYRNADPPILWPDNSASCQRRCLRALTRLAS